MSIKTFPFQGSKLTLITTIHKLIAHESINQVIDLFGGSGVVSANLIRKDISVWYNETNDKCHKILNFLQQEDAWDKIEYIYNQLFYLENDRYSIDDIVKWLNEKQLEPEWESAVMVVKFKKKLGIAIQNHDIFDNKKFLLETINGKIKKSNLEVWKYELKELQQALKRNTFNTSAINALDLLNNINEEHPNKTLIYIDPPYLETDREYNSDFWGYYEEHKLIELLVKLSNQGYKIIFSNHRKNTSWRVLAEQPGFKLVAEIDVKGFSSAIKKGVVNKLREEIMVTNIKDILDGGQ